MQDFMWFAKYKNGTILSEFDNNGGENSFYDIVKEDVAQFGVVGAGNILMFDALTGVFILNGEHIDIHYGDTELTNGNTSYTDIISFKDAGAYLLPNGQTTDGVIDKYNFGYKCKINGFNMQCIVFIDMVSGKIYLNVRLVSAVSANGNIKIRDINIPAPLDANIASEITIQVN